MISTAQPEIPCFLPSAFIADDELVGGREDDARQFAGVRADRVDLIEPQDRRGIVNRVDHVVERPREGVDVFAVERRHEGLVEPLDDFVGNEVALVLDFLDLVRLVPKRLRGGEHFLQQGGAVLDLLRHSDEIVEEPLFLGNQSEPHAPSAAKLSRTGADLTCSTHACYIRNDHR